MGQDAGSELKEGGGPEGAVGGVAEGAAAGEVVEELVGQAGGIEGPEVALQLAELDLAAGMGWGRGGGVCREEEVPAVGVGWGG